MQRIDSTKGDMSASVRGRLLLRRKQVGTTNLLSRDILGIGTTILADYKILCILKDQEYLREIVFLFLCPFILQLVNSHVF